MLPTVEGITGGSQLFDTTQTLKFFCINQVIDDLIIDMDVVVNWVTEYFFRSYDHYKQKARVFGKIVGQERRKRT